MNNSLERLYEGMAASLSERILPHIQDDFARGQAYGLVYLLRCLNQRTGWAGAYLEPQWEALRDVADEMAPLLADVQEAPQLAMPDASALPLDACCAQARTTLCELYDWAERNASLLAPERLGAIRRAWQRYIERDLKLELSLRERLPYSEMSTGHPASTSLESSP
ncbi:hypothetical protein J7E70_15630 [Variovorax paradoxus]|nr:hypothetical protein [Variovorax paradoxus]MBT2301892.1 hypothetical protein [Variovorax paradoxus]